MAGGAQEIAYPASTSSPTRSGHGSICTTVLVTRRRLWLCQFQASVVSKPHQHNDESGATHKTRPAGSPLPKTRETSAE